MPSRTAVASANHGPFSHQPQEHPLNVRAISDLETLKRTHATRQLGATKELEARLEKAAEFLKAAVAEINDRGTEETTRRKNRLERRGPDQPETQEEKAQYDELQAKVKTLTGKMDEGVRKIIDDQTWKSRVAESLDHVISKSKDAQSRKDQADEEAAEAQAEADDDSGDRDRPERTVFQAGESASSLLHAAESTADTEWNAMSLTERYANHDYYDQFFRMKWDAQHPGEGALVVPPSNMYFAEQEGRSQRANRSQPATQNSLPGGFVQSDEETDNVDESELQVYSENRSCKCPLTLQYFESPVTSKKCPHSFEKSAILDLIRQMRGNIVQCPETGCNEMLGVSDLSDDALLKRKTQRAIAAEQAEQEAEESEDDSDEDVIGTQRKRRKAVRVTSSPAPQNRRRTLIKNERDRGRDRSVSVVPDSQPVRNRRDDVMDIDEDEENDDDEE